MRYTFQILVAFALGCAPGPAPLAPDLGVPPDLGVRCADDEGCDDDDPCTDDTCVAGRCVVARAATPPLELEGVIPAAGLTGVALADDRLWLTRVDEQGSALEGWDLSTLPAAMQVLDRAAEADEGAFLGVQPLGERLVVFEAPTRARLLGADGAALGLYRAADPIQASHPDGPDRLVVAVFSKGLEVIDFSGEPSRVARVDTPGRALGVAESGRLWLVADGLAGLSLVNRRAEPPRRLEEVRLPTRGRVVAVDADGALAVTAETGAGVGVFDLVDAPARVSTLPLGGPVHDVALVGPRLAAAATDAGLTLVDLLRPGAPTVWGVVGADVWRVEVQGPRIVAAGPAAVEVYRLTCAEPEPEGE